MSAKPLLDDTKSHLILLN